IELFFAHTISPLFVAIVVPGAVLVALLLYNWALSLALLPFLAGVALTPRLASGAMEQLGAALRDGTGALNASMVDGVQGLRTIAAFDAGPALTEEIATSSRRFATLQVRFFRDQALQTAIIEVLTGLGALTVLAVGAGLVTHHQLARTDLLVATVLAAAAFGPVTELVKTLKELMQTLASARRYFAIEDEPVPVQDGPGVPEVAAEQRASGLPVVCTGVIFRYAPQDPPAVLDVSFSASAGTTVALVGRSGAGKTTLAHLLLRFWDPQQGRILIDGHDLRDYALDDLRRLVALVAQDTYLFNTTLWENLKLGRPEASDEEVLEAARRANVDEFAAALPDGYQTHVGERGMQLSGGQRQRVAIARALLKDAPVLILDEATSHLDAVNEAEVRRALDRLMAGRTTFVIAHRLSTIRNADEILVLDEGRLVERGTHAELLARDGLYSHLIAAQLMARVDATTQRTVGVEGGA
ncbi:MAG TPA: ABC transporter ATP-binding protein, partial [Dehalococcoidia bacterium]